jgi:aminopeptidase-like protein
MTTTSVPRPTEAGQRMLSLAETLFPLCRSITGDGVRATLREVGRRIPLDVHDVPSGTHVLDWVVPDEWNIRDAYIAEAGGERVVDFEASNLHVVSYSAPFRGEMSLAELRPHLHTHPNEPDWIPYRTSYYDRTWGFCLSERQLDALDDGPYEVIVDSTLAPGSLTYAECVVQGELDDEVLLTTHVCHPSLANDNLSGVVVLTELAAALVATPRRLTYRVLFIPGTIGSIAWLARNEAVIERVTAGLVIACVGDSAPLSYKRSRRTDALVDRAAAHVVGRSPGGTLKDFVPWGWDERQFNSPGFDLPVGCLTRSAEGDFPEYHSSADNLGLISPVQLEGALEAALAILDVLDDDRSYLNLQPKGEPQLGRRGLYKAVGGGDPSTDQLATLWILNQSDGARSLLDIAERSGIAFADLQRVARRLVDAGLLEERGWTLA